MIVLYTDGISEAMNRDADLSATRASAASSRSTAISNRSELRERILREIESFVGAADQHDDMTMILMKVEQPVVERPGPRIRARRCRTPAWSCSRLRESMTDLVTVFRTPSPIEADVVRGLLETHGIDALVSVGHAADAVPDGAARAAPVGARPRTPNGRERIIESHRDGADRRAHRPVRRRVRAARAHASATASAIAACSSTR